jgi:hypothetical protein
MISAIPLPVRRAWARLAPISLQTWAHRKADDEWRPSKLIADRLPHSVIYWAVIRAGVETIRGNEIVPDVPYVEVLERIGDRAERYTSEQR